MNKNVTRRRESKEFYTNIFTGKTKEEGVAYIRDNVPNNKISRALIAAFIAQCCGQEGIKWLNEKFMVEAYDTIDGAKVYNQRVGKRIFLEDFKIVLPTRRDTYDEFAELRIATEETPKKKEAATTKEK